MKPVLGIPLEFGFHEIKKYILSGFTKQLSQQFDIVWFAIDKGNSTFDNYFRNTGFPIVYFKENYFESELTPEEIRNNSIRKAWMKINNVGLFHNYKKISAPTFKEKILGSHWLKSWSENRTLKMVAATYENESLKQHFKKYNIQKVLATGYGSQFAKAFFATACRMNIQTNYLVNSWKDLYTNNFVPFKCLKNIFVWDQEMANKYLFHMPYLQKKDIHVTGNPTFDILKQYQPVNYRQYYANKYQLNNDAKWLLYTMMPPGIVNDEIETIKRVAQEILSLFSEKQIQILIRKNPNHQPAEFSNELLPVNCKIAQHYCSFDPIADMIVQSEEGEKEWLDLLFHAQVNLSVPSTVTLEILALNKLVINIAFGPDGLIDTRIIQHFNAGFYRDLFNTDSVVKITDIKDLIPVLNKALEIQPVKIQKEPVSLASQIIIQHLLN